MRTILAVLAIALSAVAPAARAQDPAYVTAVAYQYFPGDARGETVALEIAAGTPLRFLNLDVLGYHNIVSEDVDENGYPIFDSGEAVSAGSTSDVRGVDLLRPGTYGFYCPTHGYDLMAGRLIVR